MKPADQSIIKLQSKLDKVSDPKTKRWFENYLKQKILYRGVKTPEVIRLVAEWRNHEKSYSQTQLRLSPVAGRSDAFVCGAAAAQVRIRGRPGCVWSTARLLKIRKSRCVGLGTQGRGDPYPGVLQAEKRGENALICACNAVFKRQEPLYPE